MSKHTIEQILPAQPGWRLVTLGTEETGTMFLDVACWALVRFGDDERRVVPMFAPVDSPSGDLAFLAPGDEDVVGIASPGDNERQWDEVAVLQRRERREVDEERDRKQRAERIAHVLGTDEAAALRETADPPRDVVTFTSAAMMVALAEYGLVEPHCESSRQLRGEWYVTPLGRDTLRHLDARAF